MAEKKKPKISIGITSMTVILCVLCLTVFSVLTLSTALSEQKFSEKKALSTQNYYAAEAEAAAIVNGLQEAWKSGEDLRVFSEKFAPTKFMAWYTDILVFKNSAIFS